MDGAFQWESDAAVTGVPDSYLSQVERGLYRTSTQVAKALANAFGVSPQTLYTKLGRLDGESEAVPGVEQAIEADDRLGPEQRKALVLMYRTLVEPARSSTGRGQPATGG